MQHATPPRRPVRPRLSTSQASPSSHAPVPSAPALNTLSAVLANNSIANSNVTSSHFLGSGALQRPWMRQYTATARPTPAALTSDASTSIPSCRSVEESVLTQHASTAPSVPAIQDGPAQLVIIEGREPHSHCLISESGTVPPSDPVSLQNADTNKAPKTSATSTQQAATSSVVTVLDPTSANNPPLPTQSASDPQPTVSADLPILDITDNLDLVTRSDPIVPVPYRVDNSSGLAHNRTGSNDLVSQENVSAHISSGAKPSRANTASSLCPDQLSCTSFNANARRVSCNMPPRTCINNQHTQNSAMTMRPMQQTADVATNHHVPPAQLLTPEPSPLIRAAPLVENERSAQGPPQSRVSHLPRTASVQVHNYPQMVTQPQPDPRVASTSSSQSTRPAKIDLTLRGLLQPQGDHAVDNRGQAYLATLESNIQDMSRRIDLNNHQWTSRLPWLQYACRHGDLFFLHLNQLFCMRTINVEIVRYLGAGSECDPGFAILALLFCRNELLPRELLAFLSGWPNSTFSLELNEEFKQCTSEIIRFLPVLASNWSAFWDRCMARRVPPMVLEIMRFLSCPLSLMLPKAIFCSVSKALTPTASQDFQNAVFNLFNSNAALTYSQQSGCADFSSFRTRYHAICLQYLENPSLSPAQANELRFILQSVPPITNPRPVIATQPAHRPIRTSSITVSPDLEDLNVTSPADTAPRSVPPYSVVSENSQQLSNSQHRLPRRALWVPVPIQHSHRNSVQQLPSGSGPIQGNHTFVHNPPPGFATVRQPSNDAGPVPNNARSAHSLNQVFTRPINMSLSGSSPRVMLQVQGSLIATSDTLLPAPGGPLPNLVVNPDPLQESLHQVLLRQPVTELEGPHSDNCQRLFQYIVNFVLKPYQWIPTVGYISIEFDVPQELLNRRSETIEEWKGPFTMPKRLFGVDSLLFNLRCVKLESPSQQTDLDSVWAALPTHWPQHIFVSINGEHLELRRKRHNTRDLPIDVTSFLKVGKNEVEISFHPEASERNVIYGVAVEVIGFCDYEKALTLPVKIDAETSLGAITDAMKPHHDSDDDDLILVDDKMTISITDPFSSRIFTTPVRGKTCKHRECFDLETLLSSRRSDYKDQLTSVYAWQCPICKSDARPQNLIIDGFFREVRDTIVRQGSEDQARAIVVNSDGSWQIKENIDADQTPATRSSRQRSSSSRPSQAPPDAKRIRCDERATDGISQSRPGADTFGMTTTHDPVPPNPRATEIIELD